MTRLFTLAAAFSLLACSGAEESDGGDGSNGASGGATSAGGSGGSLTDPATGGASGGSLSTGGSGSGGVPTAGGPDPECLSMVDAANAFLDGLEMTRLAQVSFSWDAPARSEFEFLPPGNEARDGLSMVDMSDAEQVLLESFLATALSQTGKQKVDDIRALETLLGEPPYRDPENYFVWFFGVPSSEEAEPWGFRFEGHHLSLHTSVIGCRTYSATPTFWGSSPNTSPFTAEIAARDAFWLALSDAERGAAGGAIDNRGSETKTGSPTPYGADGIAAKDLTADKQALLSNLVELWLSNMAAPIAEERRQAIEAADFGEVRFVADGNNFRVQGPTFLIEFAYADPTHVHSAWRDFDGDWGEDLLARHLAEHHAQ